MTALLTYDEIKDIVVNRLGIRDLPTYKAWGDTLFNRRITQQDVDLLSPDRIDNGAFWRLAEELFQTDPVINCQMGTPFSIEEANKRAMDMYHMCGFTGRLLAMRRQLADRKPSLLEVGPGYGAFRSWLATNIPNVEWIGMDVYPKCVGCQELPANGCLPPMAKYVPALDTVFSNNVFQHLSFDQRRAYYRDVYRLLAPGGLFMFNMMLDRGGDHPMRDVFGHHWCRHYGQFTRIERYEDAIQGPLNAGFVIEAVTTTNWSWITLTCTKPDSR